MKRIVFSLLAAFIAFAGMAQSPKFAPAMGAALKEMNEAKTTAEKMAVAAKFERIGDAEKDQWLPYYYAGLTLVLAGFDDNTADKDALGSKASTLADKAMSLTKSSEPYAVKSMSATLQMMVNPMERWQTYGNKSSQALKDGLAVDGNNPRLYYLQGVALLRTPVQFGGGKDKALPLLEKAMELYEKYPVADPLQPRWGKEQIASSLASAKS